MIAFVAASAMAFTLTALWLTERAKRRRAEILLRLARADRDLIAALYSAIQRR